MTLAPADRRLLAAAALLALAACAVALLSGVGCAVVYTSWEPAARRLGLTLQSLRPIHDSAAFAWVFLGGVTCIYAHLILDVGPLSPAERRRAWLHLGLWLAAGVGIVVSLLAGRFSGREYVGYSPVFSVPILAGWLLFASTYYRRGRGRLRDQPVYLLMWSFGIGLFVISYCESHLYLLAAVSRSPLADLAIEWRANGVLVGSFNQLANGSLLYVAGKLRGDDRYARSRTAFALFAVGLLNTLTNYGHHTYHLPQSELIHRISFGVSMLEGLLLGKVGLDVLGLLRAPPAEPGHEIPTRFIRSATVWTLLFLALAIAISVPPLNALVHGTHVVVAHSMGSMIGIDSMILWGVLAWLRPVVAGERAAAGDPRRVASAISVLDWSLGALWLALIARGVAAGWERYASGPVDISLFQLGFPPVLLTSGAVLAVAALWILGGWVGAWARCLREA